VGKAALMREAALKSAIFVGVPRVCRTTNLPLSLFLIFLFTYRPSELSRDSQTRLKTT